ncbi:MAG: hypothetical protein VR73_12795 [Gammaproteobacteria bacterium BRH_c0]|nr:MAG: hypothetical protein VR73_12795 [Gammaproteobacteria bacterium BRH_c0]
MLKIRQIAAAIDSPWGQLLLAIAALLLVATLSFLLGNGHFSRSMGKYRHQEQELAAAREEIARLKQELVNREVAEKVDSGSLEQMRQQVGVLQDQLSRQEGELGLYRNLFDDNEEPSGLHIDSLNLRRAPGADSFQYRIVVRRKATLNESVDVAVSLSIDGQKDGVPVSIPFNEADLSLQGEAMSIRFKYFKVLRGAFVLPADFVPTRVVLSVLEKDNPSSLRIVQFPWSVENY